MFVEKLTRRKRKQGKRCDLVSKFFTFILFTFGDTKGTNLNKSPKYNVKPNSFLKNCIGFIGTH